MFLGKDLMGWDHGSRMLESGAGLQSYIVQYMNIKSAQNQPNQATDK